jgi:hypothetical protein
MSAAETDFSRHVLKELESLFEEGRITTLVRRSSSSEPGGPPDVGVKIVDSRTGEEFVEDRFQSQIENKAVALLTLLRKERSQ